MPRKKYINTPYKHEHFVSFFFTDLFKQQEHTEDDHQSTLTFVHCLLTSKDTGDIDNLISSTCKLRKFISIVRQCEQENENERA